MNSKIFWYEAFDFVFVCVLGTLLHFLYDWTNLLIFAPISAVNESTWEHMKILYIPCFTFAIIQSFSPTFKIKDFFNAKLFSMGLSTAFIPIAFYTINGALFKTPFYVDILLFYIAALLNSLLSYFAVIRLNIKAKSGVYGLIGALLILLAFITFTFYPPALPIFISP